MTSNQHMRQQGAHVRLAEADTADLFRIVRNLREPGWAREVALKRIEGRLDAIYEAAQYGPHTVYDVVMNQKAGNQ